VRLLLINPPTNSIIKSVIGVTGPPLGLAYLASVSREKGHDVRIIDALATGSTFLSIKKEIESYSPDVVGITATTSMIYDAYEVAREAKDVDPHIVTVLGGPHVTFAARETLEESQNIDFIVRGEGEITFLGLLEALQGKRELRDVPGITFRTEGGIHDNPPQPLIEDIDSIPPPAIDLLPVKHYTTEKKRFMTIVTSRGCPYNCTFCSSSLQFGRRWRGHSTERVIDELRNIVDSYGVREIEFLDDTFTLNLKRAMEVSREIYREGLDISWSASARVNLFNREIASSMKKGGAHTVYFGIESGSQRIINFIGKGIRPEMVTSSVRAAREEGLKTMGSFIIGFPDETKEEVRSTLKLSRKVGVDVAQFTIATPYPGTRLWYYAKERGLLFSNDWRKYTTLTPVMRLKHFTSKQIMYWLGKAYATFYLRPNFLLKDLLRNHGFIFKRIIPYYSKFMTGNPLKT